MKPRVVTSSRGTMPPPQTAVPGQSAAAAALPWTRLSSTQAVPMLALTVVIMAYSSLFALVPILLFYLLWLPQAYANGRWVVLPSRDMIPGLAFVTLAVVSVAWSAYPAVTIRAALEYASMFLCSVIVARRVAVVDMVKGLALGATVTLALTLISGNYGRDYFTGVYALVGLFGSKNQVGFIAEIGIYAALALVGTRRGWTSLAVFVLAPLAVCGVSLVLCRSSSSVVSLACALLASGGVWVLRRTSRRHVLPGAVIIAGFLLAILILGYYADWDEALFQMLGKDSTLTGRTYLWGEGSRIGHEMPWLGHGYDGFWVPGQPQAERYWREFYVYNQTGFHFHNLYIQTFVDLGSVGVAGLLLLYGANTVAGLRYAVLRATGSNAFLLSGIVAMLFVRSFVEVDTLGPFGMGQLICFMILPLISVTAPPRRAKTPGVPLIKIYEPAASRGRGVLKQ